MRDQSLSRIAVLLFDPVPANRELTHDALLNLGGHDLGVPTSLDDARALLAQNDYDLLILDATDDDGQICGAIGDLRHSRLGRDPFTVALATMWRDAAALSRKLVNAGIDDILLQPISTALLQTRIRQQVYARRPFVVTSTYIGPDRRGDLRAQTGEVRIPVPNSLREKLVGTASAIMIADAVTKTRAVVNEQRVAQAASKIGVYCALILDAPEKSPEAESDIAAMKSTIADLAQWASPKQFGAVLLHCEKLAKLAEQPDTAQIRRSLGQIAVETRAIRRKLDPEKDDEGLNAEIANAARRLAAHRTMEARARPRGKAGRALERWRRLAFQRCWARTRPANGKKAMFGVVLILHLMIICVLIGVVLLQRSEGGALGGLGGGGGGLGGLMTGRGAANVLTRTTAILAAAFFVTSIALSVLVGHRAEVALAP